MTAAVTVNIRGKSYPAAAGVPAHQALAALDFTLARREFVAVSGPSGCGKTTLLHMVAGLDRDFSGTIRTASHEDGRPPRIGYVFQNPRLLPWRTVRENVLVALQPEQDPEIADRLIEAVGLAPARNAYPSRLSGGMARRAALARAFAVEPDLLLMDEPFVSLDPDAAGHLRALLLQLWQARPTTVLFVTHELREALILADRLLLLSGPPARLLAALPVGIPRDKRGDAALIADLHDRVAREHRRLMNEKVWVEKIE